MFLFSTGKAGIWRSVRNTVFDPKGLDNIIISFVNIRKEWEYKCFAKSIRFIYALMIWNVQLNSMKNSLIEQEVSEKGDVGSCFEVDGFRFNLFAYKVVNEKHIFGSNCLPSLHFDTLEKMKEKLEGKEICFPLMQIGKNWVAEFVDSEGNHIEVYTAVSQ